MVNTPSRHHRKHVSKARAYKDAKHVSTPSTLARQARGHASTPSTWARKHAKHATTPSTRFSRLCYTCYCKKLRTKWLCCTFKLGFLQLTSKASLIFKWNLELALSIFFLKKKKREWYEPKHDAVECRCLKIWELLSFLLCSSILVLKWQQVSPIQLELQLAQVNLYTRKEL